jgi:alkylhydroperoxidase family enzyme
MSSSTSFGTTAADATLAQSLRPAAVDFSRLRGEYGPMLQIVRLIIGVVPNCDSYLAIWPTGFRTYNLLVPNLLNLPFSVWGFGPPAVTLGLALLAASRAAQCAYCTAHTCAFTLRRGSPVEKLAGNLTTAERAAASVAAALAHVPCELTSEQRAELLRCFSPADAEHIVLGIALMGFLNKFMDAVGIDLEPASYKEVSQVLAPTGWTPGKHRIGAEETEPDLQARPGGRDTWLTKLAILRHVPAAVRLDRRWMRKTPRHWPAVGAYLQANTGYDFPWLAQIKSTRAVQAIATVLCDNLNASTSRLGLQRKALAGLVYASVVGNETLAREARRLASQAGFIEEGTLDAIARFASEPSDFDESAVAGALAEVGSLPGLGEAAPALLLAKAVSPSPARVTAPLVAAAAAALSPEVQIELVVWISVQQMLHRLECFLTL